MSWYRDYKEQWKEIIETVAAEEHRTTQMVEKDTIQSMILSSIFKVTFLLFLREELLYQKRMVSLIGFQKISICP